MTNSHPLIGQHINKADTPALWVDLDALDSNTTKMYELAKSHWVRWRPHVKASKSPNLAKRLLEGGAQGITCAKVSEAEAMVAGGVTDILIANEVIGQTKILRLVKLAEPA